MALRMAHVPRIHPWDAAEPVRAEPGLDRADRRGEEESRTICPCNENPTWVSPQPPNLLDGTTQSGSTKALLFELSIL